MMGPGKAVQKNRFSGSLPYPRKLRLLLTLLQYITATVCNEDFVTKTVYFAFFDYIVYQL